MGDTILKKLIWLLLALLAPSAFAVGTCVVTNVTSTQIASESNRIADSNTVIVTLVCTADASAATFPAATVPLTGSYPSVYLNTYNLTGYVLYQVGRTPGGTAPTANYTTVIPTLAGLQWTLDS